MPVIRAGRTEEELAKVAGIKAKVGPAAFRFTDRQLVKLCELTGDVGLACDCLSMCPWPSWLERFAEGKEPLTVRPK